MTQALLLFEVCVEEHWSEKLHHSHKLNQIVYNKFSHIRNSIQECIRYIIDDAIDSFLYMISMTC